MILNFQRRFQPFILDGSKTHTIRGERADGKRPLPGEMLHLYTGLRQKGSEFILRAPCLRTEDLGIESDATPTPTGGCVYSPPFIAIAGNRLTKEEADVLAWRDGFRILDSDGDYTSHTRGCFKRMMDFWNGKPMPFRGWITYWDYTKAQFERRAA